MQRLEIEEKFHMNDLLENIFIYNKTEETERQFI